MDNRIVDWHIRYPRWDPGEAELWITVSPRQVAPGTEIRGRLVGPRCTYTTTVEVAYPLRPPTRPSSSGDELTGRIVIPEASLWEPQCPFLYEGTLELWEEGKRCDQVVFHHGLRLLQASPHGLRLNGRSFLLRARSVESMTKETALHLRAQGLNAILVPASKALAAVGDLCDRLGFFVIGEVNSPDEVDLLDSLVKRPSFLGAIVPEVIARNESFQPGYLLGVHVQRPFPQRWPEGISFLVCQESERSDFAASGVDKLIISAS
jgi:hypothetical protein